MEKLKSFLESLEDAKILDVGTGRGNFISLIDYLYSGYAKIVGIDILDKMVEIAEKHFEANERIKIVKRDILDTGFPKEHFDLVCLSNSLHHLDDVKATIQAMESLVKPGGFLLFNEMRKDDLNEQQRSHLLIHHFSAKLDREIGMIHNDTYDRQEIIDLVKANTAFKIADVWDMVVPVSETSAEEIDAMIRTVDQLLMRLRDDQLISKHKAEAETIKDYLKEHGLEACPQLVVIAKKPLG